jgi:Catalase
MINKNAQFNREKVPERVVHARGMTAKGFFEASAPIYTCLQPSSCPGCPAQTAHACSSQLMTATSSSEPTILQGAVSVLEAYSVVCAAGHGRHHGPDGGRLVLRGRQAGELRTRCLERLHQDHLCIERHVIPH